MLQKQQFCIKNLLLLLAVHFDTVYVCYKLQFHFFLIHYSWYINKKKNLPRVFRKGGFKESEKGERLSRLLEGMMGLGASAEGENLTIWIVQIPGVE